MPAAPPDRPDIANRPADLDVDAQRMRASLRAKMFGIAAGTMTIGRFTVVDLLGRGGTGIVYAAHDPRLDRKVAIKVLAAATEDASPQRQRIAREAQVLATLSHPNIVQIYEVGTVDRLMFLAMEYVEGTTMEAWQKESSRSWREVVEKYAQAGAGLAAAHREGVVHRDVKPANLLLGRDGRVRVVDFGLARSIPDEPGSEPDAPRDIESMLELDVTLTDDIMGTPAYMAPEQIARRHTDPRSDQFSFCVSLYEALFGERPHAGRTSAELLLAIVDGGHAPIPRTRGVPRRICAALERGLSRDPAARFPSMEALCTELQPARRRIGLVPAVVAASVMVVGAAWIYGSASSCGSEAALANVWNDAQREAIAHAFARTGIAAAPAAEYAVTLALDDYARAWTDARHDACTVDPALLDRRMACLDHRRQALDALVRRLADADAEVVHNAVDAAHDLPRIAACADDDTLQSSVDPPSEPLRADVAAVRAAIEEASAQSALGHYRDGLQQAERAVERARAIAYSPVLAEAALELGRAHARLDHPDAARPALLEAIELAEANRHDEVAADAAIELVYTLVHDRDEALDAYRRADAAVLRLDDDPIRRAALVRGIALAHYFAGDVAAARPAFEQALALQRRELGDRDLEVARTLGNYADALAWAGNVEEALPYFEEARAAFVDRVGPMHPRVGMILFVHGLALQAIARYDEARAKLDAALDVYVGAFGRDSAKVATALEAVAKLELERQRFAEGVAPAREAARIRSALEPAEDRITALVLVAQLEHAVGHPHAAIAPYRDALALLGDDSAQLEQRAIVQTNLGLALHEAERSAEAIAALQRSLTTFATPELASHPARVQAVLGLADAFVAAGRPADAVAMVKRAMAELPTDDAALAQWIEQHP